MLLERTKRFLWRPPLVGTIAALSLTAMSAILADADDAALARPQAIFIPTGQYVTPTAAPGSVLQYLNPGLINFPKFIASGALSSVKSPDGRILLVLVSGYNSLSVPKGQTEGTNEYVFVFDISTGKPTEKQVLQIPNSYVGICFAPDGRTFYVGGGQDDNIHVFTMNGSGQWAESGTPIALGHKTGLGLFPGDILPETAGLAITPDGSKLLVVNYENDSFSIVDPKARKVLTNFDLRPGVINKADTGESGGEFPFWVVLKGNTTAYISSIRDREIDVIDLSSAQPSVTARVKVSGNPNKMILDRAEKFLYVTEDNSDILDVINTSTNAEEQSVRVTAPDNYIYDKETRYPGGSPNSLVFSPDGLTLYVTNYGTNAVSVVRGLPYHPQVVGLIPTGFAPNAVSISNDGKYLYVSNGRDRTGPNPGYTFFNRQDNQYVYDLEKSSLLTIPIPNESELAALTDQVAQNDFFKAKQNPDEASLMAELHRRIKHVIYLVKENRTYDQILGDLDRGNGDPALTDFGQQITPNYHRICQQFVTLDNFYVSGDVSGDGHIWSFAGRQSDISQKNIAINYGHGGTSYDSEGTNRDIIVGLPTVAQRKQFSPLTPNDPNLLPGTADEFACDGPFGTPPQKGYIWDAALRAGLSVRNYGFYCDETRYSPKNPYFVPLVRYPAAKHLRVGFPAIESLIPYTDPYFRSFDTAFPDYWRENEWEREFAEFVKNGTLPALSMVRHMEDHMGSFGTAIDGVNTPELQQADNDYAVARLIDKVAHSPYKYDTLICILEDDSQDGADHVDSHRSTAYIVGPYVKHGVVVSERYTTVSMIRTIEDVLGTDHLNIRTANQGPMSAVFDLSQREWNFTAEPSTYLYNTELPIKSGSNISKANIPKPAHHAAYWAKRTAGFDFSKEDAVDPERFDQIIWVGLHGHKPYPTRRSGLDLRNNRDELLRKVAAGGGSLAQE